MSSIVDGRIVIEISDIRGDFPEFADITAFPDSLISSAIKKAGWFVSTKAGQAVPDEKRIALLECFTAHLIAMNQQMAASGTGASVGQAGGQVASASIGGVAISVAVPRNKNAQEYWLNQSRYGQEYLALIDTLGAMPIYMGGSLEKVFF